MTDEYITDHPYQGELRAGASCQFIHDRTHPLQVAEICGQQAMAHANPGSTEQRHLINTHPHDFVPQKSEPTLCDYRLDLGGTRICGYPQMLHVWAELDRREAARKAMMKGQLVRKADAQQYERQPMPDAARLGPTVTLIDAPVDPLGTLAVIGGIYTGQVARSKSEVTDEQRRQMLADMQATTLDGPLEAIQFTFLVEGVSRAFTHQAVRNRFSFFAQESLRFAVAEDWAQEVPLPPSLASLPQDAPAVGVWRKAMNQSEDNYNALIGAGMPAEEARDVLVHAITTRYYWTVSLRTLLQEAGKRTCTQAQFHWRQAFAGVAKALRERGSAGFSEEYYRTEADSMEYIYRDGDGWQYTAFADLVRPVCYQQGKCGFMAKFDRGCTIRARVDANERLGRPSSEWGSEYDVVPPHEVVVGVGPKSVVVDANDTPLFVGAIDPREWAADPAAARVVGRDG
jgi:flavin-dependent thymidylate synthase